MPIYLSIYLSHFRRSSTFQRQDKKKKKKKKILNRNNMSTKYSISAKNERPQNAPRPSLFQSW